MRSTYPPLSKMQAVLSQVTGGVNLKGQQNEAVPLHTLTSKKKWQMPLIDIINWMKAIIYVLTFRIITRAHLRANLKHR